MKCLRISVRPLATTLIALLLSVLAAATKTELSEGAKLLPDKVGSFNAKGPAAAPSDDLTSLISEVGVPSSVARRDYSNDQGMTISVTAIHTDKGSAAYALLGRLAPNTEAIKTGVVGIASVSGSNTVLFCKGNNLVRVIVAAGDSNADQVLTIARDIAASLPEGDDDIPVLVKHLPDGQTTSHASYAVSLNGLKAIAPNQPIIDTIGFEGGTEAVAANYGQSQVVIVEFTTPQLSIDNDQRIWTRIGELKAQGQPAPSAYRRVGNYSVFVFNAPDEKTANALIDQVKYEQVVQWLGEDPHLYEKLERYLTQTSAGVLITVLESSGLSLLVCLGLGALFGTFLFRYRRAQRATSYSDAGGSVRLNLDELTANDDARRLLKLPSPRESPSKQS